MLKTFNQICSKVYTKALIAKLHREEEGASLVEYGLLVGLIAVACIAAISTLGSDLSNMFDDIAGEISGVTVP